MATEPETIQIPYDKETARSLADLADAIRGGALRDPAQIADIGSLSYCRQQPRTYMSPVAAKLLGDRGRQYVGGKWLTGDAYKFSQPDVKDVHVDAIMTEISVRYQNTEYIGGLIIPSVPVTKRSDKFFIFDKQPWLRDGAKVRAPGAAAMREGYTLTTANYSTVEWAMEHKVPDEVRENADSPLSPDRDGAEFCADKVAMRKEKLAATLINTSGNWTTNVTLAGPTQWSDYTNSDPLADIATARLQVLKQIARRPNTLVMGVEVFEKLMLHPDLLGRVIYSGTQGSPAMVTSRMLAQLFQVERVLVGAAIEDTAIEGGTESISFIWGKHVWLGYVNPRPAINTPSAGYNFTIGMSADRYRDENVLSDIIRCREEFDMRKVAAGAGYRLVNAVA